MVKKRERERRIDNGHIRFHTRPRAFVLRSWWFLILRDERKNRDANEYPIRRSLNRRDGRLAGSLSKLIVTLSGRGQWICNRVQVWINFRRWRHACCRSSKQEEEEEALIGRPRTILINMRRASSNVCQASILFICDSDQNSNGKTYRFWSFQRGLPNSQVLIHDSRGRRFSMNSIGGIIAYIAKIWFLKSWFIE